MDSKLAAAQTLLNQLGMASPELVVDGIMGPKTQAAISTYQSQNGLAVNGILDDPTLQKLGLPTNASSATAGSIANVRGIDKLSADDLYALATSAFRLGIDPDWLAAVMSFESGFSPSIKNAAGSGATGLIQFMPSTAAGLGTTTDSLSRMTFQQQLPYVERYFAPYVGKMQSLEDTYLAVFYPAFIGKADDSILGYSGSAIYDQNSGFDKTGKGYVTKSDITMTIRGVLAGANGRIDVPGLNTATGLVASAGKTFAEIAVLVLLAGGAAFLFYKGMKA